MQKRLPFLFPIAALGLALTTQAQTTSGGVGIGTATPHASALLDLTSPTKGLLAPRLTAAQRTAIAGPATGLLVYQTDGLQPGFWYFSGAAWLRLPDQASAGDNLGSHQATQALVLNDNAVLLRFANDNTSQLRFDASLGGPQLFGYNGGQLGTNRGTYAPVLQWTADGQVGIGTPTPAATLDVPTGSVHLPGDSWIRYADDNKNYLRGTTILADDAQGGSVGIGTATPLTRLSISPGVLEPKLTLWDGGVAGRHYGFGVSSGQLNYHVDGAGSRHVFYAGGKNGDGAELLRIQGDGSVGIGTSAPTQKLEVAGSVKLAGAGSGLVFADGTVQTTAAVPATGAGFILNQTAAQNGASFNVGGTGTVGGTLTATNAVVTTALTGSGADLPAGVVGVGVRTDGGLNLGQTTGNIFLGYQAGQNNAGAENLFMGYRSGYVNSDGIRNVFSGFQSGYANTSGFENAFSGYFSGYANTTGSSNVFIGYGSGFYNTTGSNNTALGSRSGPASGSGALTNATALGANVSLTQSNTVVLGNNAYVGIGTSAPAFPLDVQSTQTPASFSYGWFNQNAQTGTATSTGPVSIRAVGRVVASEFNATSDARLKNVIGLSGNAADLALLNKLRITDYTMRDRVQYGSRQFKKVIAQEVEEVFPQAVNQHAGFLPDVYANAVQVELQADSLLVLTLPAVSAAKPGQRVKLIAQTGEVTGTVKAARGTTLVVRGARQLAGQPVFVFGLEHDDVRTVDYEALSMLNVSATQELARQVAELQQRNAELQQQNTALQQQNTALQTAQTTDRGRLDKLEAQAGQSAELAQRLKALENLLGTRADAR